MKVRNMMIMVKLKQISSHHGRGNAWEITSDTIFIVSVSGSLAK
jgi:hypothetical protein